MVAFIISSLEQWASWSCDGIVHTMPFNGLLWSHGQACWVHLPSSEIKLTLKSLVPNNTNRNQPSHMNFQKYYQIAKVTRILITKRHHTYHVLSAVCFWVYHSFIICMGPDRKWVVRPATRMHGWGVTVSLTWTLHNLAHSTQYISTQTIRLHSTISYLTSWSLYSNIQFVPL